MLLPDIKLQLLVLPLLLLQLVQLLGILLLPLSLMLMEEPQSENMKLGYKLVQVNLLLPLLLLKLLIPIMLEPWDSLLQLLPLMDLILPLPVSVLEKEIVLSHMPSLTLKNYNSLSMVPLLQKHLSL